MDTWKPAQNDGNIRMSENLGKNVFDRMTLTLCLARESMLGWRKTNINTTFPTKCSKKTTRNIYEPAWASMNNEACEYLPCLFYNMNRLLQCPVAQSDFLQIKWTFRDYVLTKWLYDATTECHYKMTHHPESHDEKYFPQVEQQTFQLSKL